MLNKELKVKWPKIIHQYDAPIVEWIDLCNCTMFRLISFKTCCPRDSLFVGVELKSNFLFPVDKPIYWTYVKEKLCLYEADARPLADWINSQIGIDYVQQGIYREEMIESIETSIRTGGYMKNPLIPEIIE
jgi:hypothetical protein